MSDSPCSNPPGCRSAPSCTAWLCMKVHTAWLCREESGQIVACGSYAAKRGELCCERRNRNRLWMPDAHRRRSACNLRHLPGRAVASLSCATRARSTKLEAFSPGMVRLSGSLCPRSLSPLLSKTVSNTAKDLESPLLSSIPAACGHTLSSVALSVTADSIPLRMSDACWAGEGLNKLEGLRIAQ